MIIKIDNINTDELQIYKELRENAFRSDRSFIADSPKVVNLLLESDLEIKVYLQRRSIMMNLCLLCSQKIFPKSISQRKRR
ncbi:hypothetical protein [Sulfurimonas sp. NW9]|uniref:hypothetical protein n=1 Tax=Sulfurimonas sp. NW9 TaxID=2922728 RepID=UPI003DA8EA22